MEVKQQYSKDVDFQTGLVDTINNTVNSYSDLKSKQLMWEIVKVNIREFSIKYSKLKANRNAKTIENVQDEIDVISNKVLLLESKNVLSKEETLLRFLGLKVCGCSTD